MKSMKLSIAIAAIFPLLLLFAPNTLAEDKISTYRGDFPGGQVTINLKAVSIFGIPTEWVTKLKIETDKGCGLLLTLNVLLYTNGGVNFTSFTWGKKLATISGDITSSAVNTLYTSSISWEELKYDLCDIPDQTGVALKKI